MSYTVVQQGLDTPSTEQLRRAFGGVDGLTEMDALALGKEPIGIFARGYELPLATALKDSLIKEGVSAEVLEDTSLPQLPDTFTLGRVDCTPDALVIYDSTGRFAPLAWSDIFMIAAGKVTMREFVEVEQPWPGRMNEGEYRIIKSIDGRLKSTEPRFRSGGYTSHDPHSWEVRPVDIKTREEQHDRHLLEIILNGGNVRYSINADKAPFLFTYLGERRTKNLSQDFLLLLRDLLEHAPHAALNRGASSARENAVEPFAYSNKIGFYHEIVWLLWQSTRPQK